MLPAFLAGANFVMHTAGWLESGLVSCYEKFVVDLEIVRTLREEFTPLEVDEASLAYGAHQEVGHGGHFLGAEHTLERFRDCFYRPLLSSTENFERWKRNGGSDSAERATAVWHAALERYEQPPMDAGSAVGARGVREAPPHRARRLAALRVRGPAARACPSARGTRASPHGRYDGIGSRPSRGGRSMPRSPHRGARMRIALLTACTCSPRVPPRTPRRPP